MNLQLYNNKEKTSFWTGMKLQHFKKAGKVTVFHKHLSNVFLYFPKPHTLNWADWSHILCQVIGDGISKIPVALTKNFLFSPATSRLSYYCYVD